MDPSAIEGIGTSRGMALAEQDIDPAQRRRLRDIRGSAKLADRHPLLLDRGREELKQHVPTGLAEQSGAEEVGPA